MISAVSCVSARTIQSWIDIVCDLGHSPHIVVKRDVANARELWGKFAVLPRHLAFDVPAMVEDVNGVSVWNLSPSAIHNYVMDGQLGVLSFTVKIKGKPYNLTIPVEHITNVIVPKSNLNVVIDALMFASIDNIEGFKVTTAIVKKPDGEVRPPDAPVKATPKLSIVKKED